jgi:hypothetical protein
MPGTPLRHDYTGHVRQGARSHGWNVVTSLGYHDPRVHAEFA